MHWNTPHEREWTRLHTKALAGNAIRVLQQQLGGWGQWEFGFGGTYPDVMGGDGPRKWLLLSAEASALLDFLW